MYGVQTVLFYYIPYTIKILNSIFYDFMADLLAREEEYL